MCPPSGAAAIAASKTVAADRGGAAATGAALTGGTVGAAALAAAKSYTPSTDRVKFGITALVKLWELYKEEKTALNETPK